MVVAAGGHAFGGALEVVQAVLAVGGCAVGLRRVGGAVAELDLGLEEVAGGLGGEDEGV